MFFFKRSRVNKLFQKVTDKKQIELIKTVLFHDHINEYEEENDNPMICGSFTNWETIQMQHVTYATMKKSKQY